MAQSKVLNLSGGAYYPDGDSVKYDANTPSTNRKVKTNEKNYKDIANAVNQKKKTQQQYLPSEMANAINEIVTLEEGSSDATAQAAEIASGKTAYVNGQKITGNFSIDSELTTQDTTIDSIKNNLNNKVTRPDTSDATALSGDILEGKIAYIKGGRVVGTLKSSESKPEQEKTISITENGQTVVSPDLGKTLSQVTVNTDIKGIDTSDATALSGDILEGKVAYAKDQRIIGTLKQKAEQKKFVSITKNGQMIIQPDSGKTLSQVTVNTNVVSVGEIVNVKFEDPGMVGYDLTIAYIDENGKAITRLIQNFPVTIKCMKNSIIALYDRLYSTDMGISSLNSEILYNSSKSFAIHVLDDCRVYFRPPR